MKSTIYWIISDRFAYLILLSALSLYSVFLVGCGKTELTSKWRSIDISIDGDDADWQNRKTYIEKARVAIGLFNDDKFLYLNLTPWNNGIQIQMMNMGFTVWFDPKGDRNNMCGIRFPTGTTGQFVPVSDRGNRDDIIKRIETFAESQKELEIIVSSEDEHIKMSLNDAIRLGIEVKVGNSNGKLFYELKVPLSRDELHPYTVGADTTGIISIGFETPGLDLRTMERMRKENSIPRPGGSGDMSPRDVGPLPGGIGGLPEHLELWATVKLAQGPGV